MRSFPLKTVLVAAGVALCNTLAAQNVGVGIATPAAKLEVDGGFAVTPVAVPAGAAITVPVNETVVRITNDGANVAIGVAAPATATEGQFLSIRNEDATNIATFAGTAIPAGQMAEFIFLNGGWRFRTGTATTGWALAGNAGTGAEVLGTTNAQPLRIITNNLERARVDANGNVGIGTPAPGAYLHVMGAGPQTNGITSGIALHRTTANDYAVQITNPAGGTPHIDFANAAGEDFDMRIIQTGDDALVVDGGNLGVNVPTATARLHINGAYANTFTALAAGAAPAIANNVTHVRLTDDAAALANAIVGPGAPVDGQVLTIVNNDAQAATFAGATIAATTGAASFVYANGAWRVYGNSNPTAWGLTGNTGTVAGTNYIGTFDNVALDVRTNNTIRARFTTTGAILMQNPFTVNTTIIGNTGSATTSPLGANNTLVGALAGNVMGAGDNNTALGVSALQNNALGSRGTAVGVIALANNTTGYHNTAVGYGALQSNTIGTGNTAMNYALPANTNGNYNNGYGINALMSNTTGSENNAVGYSALAGNISGIGNNALGYTAGQTNTTGNYNTFLGHGANATVNNLTNATAIGLNAAVATSNSIVLGNATVNVGVGSVTAPAARLHINGAYANTFTALAAGAAPAIANNVTHVRLTDNAAVSANAITGPAAPVDGQVLTIVNNDAEAATFAGATIAATTGAASFVYANGAWRVYGNSLGDNLGNHIATTQIQSTLGTAAAPGYSLVGDLNTGFFSPGADQMAVTTGGVERVRVLANGNVGIGTAAPTTRLHVVGAQRIVYNATTMATNDPALEVNSPDLGNPTLISRIRFHQDNQYWASMGYHSLGATNGPGEFVFWSHNSGIETRIRAGDGHFTGSVGIGTATSSALLDVVGEIQIASTGATAAAVGAGGLRWDGTNIQYSNGAAWTNMLNATNGWTLAGNAGTGAELLGTTNAQPLRIITNGADRIRVDAAGLVGIGTVAPAEQLHVFGAANAGVVIDGALASQSRVSFRSAGTERSVIYRPGGTTDLRIYGSGLGNDIIHFGATTGNVGIGVIAPSARLEVNGGLNGLNVRVGAGTGWAGQSYPTVSGTSAEQWVMIHNPHIPYLQNGVNGYAGATTGAQVRMAANTAAGTFWDAGILSTLGTDAYGISRAGGAAFVTVTNAGNMGIGTTTPTRRLFVNGDIGIVNNLNVVRRGTTPINWIDNFNGTGYYAGNGEAEEGGFYADGNYAAVISPGDNDLVKFIDEDGWDNAGTIYDGTALRARIDGAGNFFTVSDSTAKMNIVRIGNAMQRLGAINGYTYAYRLLPGEIEKNQTPIRSAGILAQEVEQVLPEAVSNTDGHYMVNYSALIPLMIEAMKEQQREIEALRLQLQQQNNATGR